MDFDPNAEPRPQAPTWATYVPSRSGKKFKVYTNRGHALTSCVGLPVSVLYRWLDHQWVEVSRFDRRERDACDVCGAEIDDRRTYGRTVWSRDEKGRIEDLPRLLLVCGYDCQKKALKK
jgi:hypothetical protein